MSNFWKPKARRRKLSDIFFADGDIYCHLNRNKFTCVFEGQERLEMDFETDLVDRKVIECKERNCLQTFDSLFLYELHYNMIHRHVCTMCTSRMPNNHLLDMHIKEIHGNCWGRSHGDGEVEDGNVEGRDGHDVKRFYHCLVLDCTEQFSTAGTRKIHLIEKHKYPSNFRYLIYLGMDEKVKNDKKNKINNRANKIKNIKNENDANINKDNNNKLNNNNNVHNKCIVGDDYDEGDDNDYGQGMDLDVVEAETNKDDDKIINDDNNSIHRNNDNERHIMKRVPKNICFGSGSQRAFRR